VAKHY